MYTHQPVMLSEVVAALCLKPGGRYFDGTLGGGGHAEAILKGSGPDGWLYGCDRDGAAVEAASKRLSAYSGRFDFRQMVFTRAGEWVPRGECDGVLVDLGVSSHQLDTGERGFSFRLDGPLDMRMDRTEGMTAADLVNSAGEAELSRLFFELGGERQSRRIARAIVHARNVRRFQTTLELAGLIEKVVPRAGRDTHPATRTFQALRIAVNDELQILSVGLSVLWDLLKPGGRLAVITFHSGEDRLVKHFGRALALDYDFDGPVDVPELRRPRPAQLRWVSRKALQPSPAEVATNPRARSAQLRVMEKI